MKDAIQSPRRNLYTLKMPHGLVLIKQDHESAHVTFKGQNFHGGSCFRIVPWDSVKSKELPQDAQLWEEKGCSPAHLTLGLQAAPPAPQGLSQLLEGFQDTMALTVFHSCTTPAWQKLVLPHSPGTQRLPTKEKE